jgi:hypothetical protein
VLLNNFGAMIKQIRFTAKEADGGGALFERRHSFTCSSRVGATVLENARVRTEPPVSP